MAAMPGTYGAPNATPRVPPGTGSGPPRQHNQLGARELTRQRLDGCERSGICVAVHNQHRRVEVPEPLTDARRCEVTGEVRAQLPVHDVVDRGQCGVKFRLETLCDPRVGELGGDTELQQLCRQRPVDVRFDVPRRRSSVYRWRCGSGMRARRVRR